MAVVTFLAAVVATFYCVCRLPRPQFNWAVVVLHPSGRQGLL